MRRAGERGVANVEPSQADAAALPYDDDSMDAVVLTAVLGEIPDREGALREIARVLRPGGRLVVGELFGDPHFTGHAAPLEQRDAGRGPGGWSTRSGGSAIALLRPA